MEATTNKALRLLRKCFGRFCWSPWVSDKHTVLECSDMCKEIESFFLDHGGDIYLDCEIKGDIFNHKGNKMEKEMQYITRNERLDTMMAEWKEQADKLMAETYKSIMDRNDRIYYLRMYGLI